MKALQGQTRQRLVMDSAIKSIVPIEEVSDEQRKTLSEMQEEELAENIKKKKDDLKELKAKIMDRLLISTKVWIKRGFKTVLEDLIILAIWSSALYKMNIQSMIDVCLVILFQVRRTPTTIKFLMNCTMLVFLVRLIIIFMNVTEDLNPMVYPSDFQGSSWKERWSFLIPFLPRYFKDQYHTLYFVQWAYWLAIYNFRDKLVLFVSDFFIIILIYVYYEQC